MSGISAFGTILRMGRGDVDPGPETFDAIAGITEIGGPGFSRDIVDATAHDSPGAFEEVVRTIIRTGELSVTINYNPNHATHSGDPTPATGGLGLLAKLVSGDLTNFQMEFPTDPAVEWDFEGYVTGFEPGAPYDDLLSADVTIKLSGQPTLA